MFAGFLFRRSGCFFQARQKVQLAEALAEVGRLKERAKVANQERLRCLEATRQLKGGKTGGCKTCFFWAVIKPMSHLVIFWWMLQHLCTKTVL